MRKIQFVFFEKRENQIKSGDKHGNIGEKTKPAVRYKYVNINIVRPVKPNFSLLVAIKSGIKIFIESKREIFRSYAEKRKVFERSQRSAPSYQAGLRGNII